MIVYNKELAEGFGYTVESERGEAKPFKVTIVPIDSVRLVTLEDGLLKRGADNSLSLSTGSHNVSLCKNAITGWDNLVDSKNKPIELILDGNGFISEESLGLLPTTVITEIAGVISSVSQDPATIQMFTEE